MSSVVQGAHRSNILLFIDMFRKLKHNIKSRILSGILFLMGCAFGLITYEFVPSEILYPDLDTSFYSFSLLVAFLYGFIFGYIILYPSILPKSYHSCLFGALISVFVFITVLTMYYAFPILLEPWLYSELLSGKLYNFVMFSSFMVLPATYGLAFYGWIPFVLGGFIGISTHYIRSLNVRERYIIK